MEQTIEKFVEVLGKDNVLVGDELAERYVHIWQMQEPLRAMACLLPQESSQISQILAHCNEHSIRIVVHGGLTNLVGGTETQGHEVVLSLEKMNRIEDVDVSSRTITVQSGVILQHVQEIAEQNELLFPMNFGAKGSAQIGGAISTNAGGLRVLRYGMMRSLVLGLEVVLADGTVLTNLKKITKDNSGYDLKHLFIGSEGTLGVVTRAVLKLVERPKSRTSAFAGLSSYDNVVALLKHMDAGLAGTMSGFELIWRDTYHAMTSPPAQSKPPIEDEFPYYVLIEALGSDKQADDKRLELLLEQAMTKGLIEDAVLAQSESDMQWFWTIREEVSHIKNKCTYEHHFDISLPIPLIGQTIEHISQELHGLSEVEGVYAFGHVADGNIHFMIGRSDETEETKKKINDIVYSPIKEIGGSVSAEHGIGLHKKAYLPLSRSEAEIEMMKKMKRLFDPKGILNPDRIFD